MAKILGKTHSPYVPDADTHSLTLTGRKHINRYSQNAYMNRNFVVRKVEIWEYNLCRKKCSKNINNLYDSEGAL